MPQSTDNNNLNPNYNPQPSSQQGRPNQGGNNRPNPTPNTPDPDDTDAVVTLKHNRFHLDETVMIVYDKERDDMVISSRGKGGSGTSAIVVNSEDDIDATKPGFYVVKSSSTSHTLYFVDEKGKVSTGKPQTSLVDTLPSATELLPNYLYYVKAGNGNFDIYITDENKLARKVNSVPSEIKEKENGETLRPVGVTQDGKLRKLPSSSEYIVKNNGGNPSEEKINTVTLKLEEGITNIPADWFSNFNNTNNLNFTDLVLPSTLTSVSDRGFAGMRASITGLNNITSAGKEAFKNTTISSILPNVRLTEGLYEGTKLEGKIEITENTLNIEDSQFARAPKNSFKGTNIKEVELNINDTDFLPVFEEGSLDVKEGIKSFIRAGSNSQNITLKPGSIKVKADSWNWGNIDYHFSFANSGNPLIKGSKIGILQLAVGDEGASNWRDSYLDGVEVEHLDFGFWTNTREFNSVEDPDNPGVAINNLKGIKKVSFPSTVTKIYPQTNLTQSNSDVEIQIDLSDYRGNLEEVGPSFGHFKKPESGTIDVSKAVNFKGVHAQQYGSGLNSLTVSMPQFGKLLGVYPGRNPVKSNYQSPTIINVKSPSGKVTNAQAKAIFKPVDSTEILNVGNLLTTTSDIKLDGQLDLSNVTFKGVFRDEEKVVIPIKGNGQYDVFTALESTGKTIDRSTFKYKFSPDNFGTFMNGLYSVASEINFELSTQNPDTIGFQFIASREREYGEEKINISSELSKDEFWNGVVPSSVKNVKLYFQHNGNQGNSPDINTFLTYLVQNVKNKKIEYELGSTELVAPFMGGLYISGAPSSTQIMNIARLAKNASRLEVSLTERISDLTENINIDLQRVTSYGSNSGFTGLKFPEATSTEFGVSYKGPVTQDQLSEGVIPDNASYKSFSWIGKDRGGYGSPTSYTFVLPRWLKADKIGRIGIEGGGYSTPFRLTIKNEDGVIPANKFLLPTNQLSSSSVKVPAALVQQYKDTWGSQYASIISAI